MDGAHPTEIHVQRVEPTLRCLQLIHRHTRFVGNAALTTPQPLDMKAGVIHRILKCHVEMDEVGHRLQNRGGNAVGAR